MKLRHIILPLIFIFFFGYSLAQKSLDGMIRAEQGFAAWSVNNGTRDAFLQYIDSNGIVFDKGKPVNGIQLWLSREKRSGVLNWHPAFAEISASGDFGYTSGPWTYQASKDDSISARGQFNTVWQMNEKGEWKFLVDLGVSYPMINQSGEIVKISGSSVSGKSGEKDYLFAEKEFQDLLKKNPVDAYKKFLSKKTILNRNGLLPAVSREEQQKLISFMPTGIHFSLSGSGIASAKDLAFVYGLVKTNQSTTNYLRIWRHEKKGWKIALEVIPL